MSIYSTLYTSICQSGLLQKENYLPLSGLHKHHIVPKHAGGLDTEENYTYLTVREHIAVHFLLWKINKNPNDLRAMKMLGAKITPQQRKITGEYCRDNNIGIFGADKKIRRKWSQNGAKTQIENKISIHNPENFQHNASLGGKASIKSPNNPWSYWASPAGRKERARLGGLSSPKKFATNGSETKKFFTDEERDKFIFEYPIWRIGVHWNNSKSMLGRPSSQMKRITDGENIYESIKKCAIEYNVSSATICNKLKSDKHPNFQYL